MSAAPRRVQVVDEPREPRRAPWRQRLVDAERGLTHGIRGDSSFFVYGFGIAACVAAALILRISHLSWTVLLLAGTVVVAVEMLHQMLKSIVEAVPDAESRRVRKALRLGTAATFVAAFGAGTVSLLILGRRFVEVLFP